MADDMETLDWGNEEEEGRAMNGGRRNFVPEEDAVSLGGDEEDEFLTHQSCLPQDEKTAHRSYTPSDPPEQKGCQVSVKSQSHSPSMGTPAKHEGQQRDLDTQANVPGPAPSTLPAKLVHALPRKPIATHVPSVHPSHPSIIEATAMASHFDRNKRSGGGLKTRSFDNGDSLPPGWEIKWSRTTNEHYYYNTRTEESTWTRPFSPNGYHSGDSRDRGLSVRNDSIPPRVGRSGDDGMSYNDRHYRPGESGLNTEKSYPTSDPSQVSDKQNGWSSPMPSVIPGDDRGHSTRRAHSPTRSQHDDVVNREASSSSALSVEDRVWVARAVEHRPHEHEVKQRESDRTSAQDRRYTRDTEKPSPLRPNPTIIYARDSQDAGASHRLPPDRPISNQKNNFWQATSASRLEQRQSHNRNAHARPPSDNNSTSYRSPVDDNRGTRRDPHRNSRPESDAGDSSGTLATEGQHSRKRTPLPPQSTIYPGGPRVASDAEARYSSSHNLQAQVMNDSMHDDISRAPDDSHNEVANGPTSHRTTFAYSSSAKDGLAERDSRYSQRDRSRGWPSHVEGPHAHANFPSSRVRRPQSIDIDHAPGRPIETSRPSTKPFYSDRNDSASRNTRITVEPVGRQRDRPFMDRHGPELVNTIPANMPRLPSPSASSIRRSGSNNIPVGPRSNVPNNIPHPSGGTHVPSGGNLGPSMTRSSTNRGRPFAPDSGTTDTQNSRDCDPVPRKLSPPSYSHSMPNESSGATAVAHIHSSRTGRSRFGPPIIKDSLERSQRNSSPDSPRSAGRPREDNFHVTPPPLSRASSMASVHLDRPPPGPLPRHLEDFDGPPRSEHGGIRRRFEEDGHGPPRDRVYSSANRPHQAFHRYPAHRDDAGYHYQQKRDPSSYPQHDMGRAVDNYPPWPAREPQARPSRYAEQQLDSTSDRAQKGPLMHPERAMLLQHQLPPKPQVDIPFSHSRSGPPSAVDRRFRSASPPTEGRRFEDHVYSAGGSRGGSLLDRLTLGHEDQDSLRGLPVKRNRQEMVGGDLPFDSDDDRARKRSLKLRRPKPYP